MQPLKATWRKKVFGILGTSFTALFNDDWKNNSAPRTGEPGSKTGRRSWIMNNDVTTQAVWTRWKSNSIHQKVFEWRRLYLCQKAFEWGGCTYARRCLSGGGCTYARRCSNGGGCIYARRCLSEKVVLTQHNLLFYCICLEYVRSQVKLNKALQHKVQLSLWKLWRSMRERRHSNTRHYLAFRWRWAVSSGHSTPISLSASEPVWKVWQKEQSLPLSGIKPRFLGYPARSPVKLPTEQCRLRHQITWLTSMCCSGHRTF
jgi:hypothetical protein